MNNISNRKPPFLRWIGGKTRSVDFILEYFPLQKDFNVYWEPFLGAGSLFFAIQPNEAIISDKNSDLILSYLAIKNKPYLLNKYLSNHLRNHDRSYYYYIREKFNSSKNSISRAAMFIYLNKTCFNGIWRVNKKGEFNVPYGKNKPSKINLNEILCYSKILKDTKVFSGDYKEILRKVSSNDFVYLDPPYPPISKTSNFTHYTAERFNISDQLELSEVISTLDSKGCKFVLSNMDTKFINNLYKKFEIISLEVTRWVRSDGKRYKIKEVIIRNY